ncbi:hypothetical protein A2954_06140 [Candidatus Roizmanbacteria bacterium RIFCSPLOWO2_01_FULL_37_12]|uniref:Uncharacterized protein n=1 Tax=Candidatus Roizmanbacteria bacterium RIFCSPLOWO2_01_FULL_37_12 TaxID=1802056 RepID=A0A1F7ICJ6_9BACT|nr:MAG: hypothetical protein A2768_01300 [Candidatus Roizmanbacteria bacterium RIFCSPHIGHO2_01_FULL_37_16]OGK24377.1 MAG: hypothetical protein A3D76_01800 [Candidatus Roizmanbacteria bacterium RIFCSPHIGHO2_02_FULL_37_9b]OGK41084.1 MAG: hypothetical protein A2954_06140 [Candidatus Roizmanbacteria bacterium RIFCSPLOWO2_01_FULL_37_12]
MVEAPPQVPPPSEPTRATSERPVKFLRAKERVGASGKEKDAGSAAYAIALKKGHIWLRERDETKKNGKEIQQSITQSETGGFAYIARQALIGDEDFKGMDFNTGVALRVDGKRILRVDKKTGTNFICTVEHDTNPVEIPAETILEEQLKIVYEQAQNTSDFTDQEKSIIKAHIESSQDKPESADALDEGTLSETAFNNGLVRAASVNTYANKYRIDTAKIDVASEDGKKEKNRADTHNQLIDTIVQPMNDRIIADPEVIGNMVNIFGSGEVNTAKSLLEADRKKLAQDTSKKRELQEIDDELAIVNEVSSAVQNARALTEEFFQSVQMGEMTIDRVQKVDTSLAKGDVQSLIENLDQENPAIGDKMKTKKFHKLINKIKDRFSFGGILGLGFAFLFIKRSLGESGIGGIPNQSG